jgi:hypothetical protein
MGMNMFVFMVMVMVVVMVVVVFMFMVMVVVVVMVVVMVMVMIVMMFMAFLLPFNENAEMRPDDAAFHRRFGDKADARQPKRIHFLDKGIFIVQKLIQCGGEHVASGSHSTIKKKRSHFLSH